MSSDKKPRALFPRPDHVPGLPTVSGATYEDFRTLIDLNRSAIACFAFPGEISVSLPPHQIAALLFGPQMRCIEANPAFARSYGAADPSDVRGMAFADFIPQSDASQAMVRRWIDGNYFLTDYEIQRDHAPGQPTSFTTGMYSTFDGSLIRKVWLVQREITGLRKTVDELKRAEEHYRTLVERPGLVLVRAKPDGTYLYISPHVSDIIGYTPSDFEKNPKLFETLLHPEDVARHQVIYDARRTRSTKTVEVEFRVRRKDGTYHWFFERQTPKFNNDGEVEYYDSLAFDIQERKQLEVELIHVQRMDIVGALAHGIAHDFNNHLTAILGQLGLVLGSLPAEGKVYSQIAAAEKAALCCAEMTRHLLSFGRKDAAHQGAIDARLFIEETVSLLKHLLPASIEITVTAPPGSATVFGNFAQLQQVLMNLAVNSRDAMPQGGTLAISVEPLAITEAERAPLFIGTDPGDYLQFTIKDSGIGIDRDLLPRIFEPFFTTKPRGQGTGLGLSMVYSIIKAHGGMIHVDSERGLGTTISFILPRSTQQIPEYRPSMRKALPTGNEVVLVADDDELVRGMMQTALEMHGYTVISAVNGEDAIDRFRASADLLRLAIIDQTMPKLSGREVVHRFRQVRPNLPIVLASGYPAGIAQNPGVHASGITFLRKPFSIQELLTLVREMIDLPAAREVA